MVRRFSARENKHFDSHHPAAIKYKYILLVTYKHRGRVKNFIGNTSSNVFVPKGRVCMERYEAHKVLTFTWYLYVHTVPVTGTVDKSHELSGTCMVNFTTSTIVYYRYSVPGMCVIRSLTHNFHDHGKAFCFLRRSLMNRCRFQVFLGMPPT